MCISSLIASEEEEESGLTDFPVMETVSPFPDVDNVIVQLIRGEEDEASGENNDHLSHIQSGKSLITLRVSGRSRCYFYPLMPAIQLLLMSCSGSEFSLTE